MSGPSVLGSRRPEYDVLVVDDDRAMLDTTMAVLELSHRVQGTTRPKRALEILEARTFHVLVVDWQMPGMGGIEFFRRATKLDPSVGGLLITGFVNEFAFEVSREQRKMLGILGKPFAPEQLLDRVSMLGRLSEMKRQIKRLREPTL